MEESVNKTLGKKIILHLKCKPWLLAMQCIPHHSQWSQTYTVWSHNSAIQSKLKNKPVFDGINQQEFQHNWNRKGTFPLVSLSWATLCFNMTNLPGFPITYSSKTPYVRFNHFNITKSFVNVMWCISHCHCRWMLCIPTYYTCNAIFNEKHILMLLPLCSLWIRG